jgi:hypothetical protein
MRMAGDLMVVGPVAVDRVRIAPGATCTTRMPCGASSRAIVWPNSVISP